MATPKNGESGKRLEDALSRAKSIRTFAEPHIGKEFPVISRKGKNKGKPKPVKLTDGMILALGRAIILQVVNGWGPLLAPKPAVEGETLTDAEQKERDEYRAVYMGTSKGIEILSQIPGCPTTSFPKLGKRSRGASDTQAPLTDAEYQDSLAKFADTMKNAKQSS